MIHSVSFEELKVYRDKWCAREKQKLIDDFRKAHRENYYHSSFFQQWERGELSDKKVWEIIEKYGMDKFFLGRLNGAFEFTEFVLGQICIS